MDGRAGTGAWCAYADGGAYVDGGAGAAAAAAGGGGGGAAAAAAAAGPSFEGDDVD